MNQNQQLIEKFYTCFQHKDFGGMQECYADHALFNDEVFSDLTTEQVRAMWKMFCLNGKDLKIEFSNISAGDFNGKAEWTATYTFSATGRKVVNHIKASFTFANGKIVSHTDSFDFYTWSKQALGITGLLFGWTPQIKKKVKQSAMKNLSAFMNKKVSGNYVNHFHERVAG